METESETTRTGGSTLLAHGGAGGADAPTPGADAAAAGGPGLSAGDVAIDEGEEGADGGASPPRFSTFTGVFTPTLLTIFGVIMYVRVGWVVGNAGLLGTWLVMMLAMGITVATGLSLSSIATNTRIGAGGPYAILARSLGFEVGGSIGLPLYLTRPLGVAMYIIGFREGWLWIFPDHPPIVIDLTAFTILTAISFISANLAFRVQFLIMAIIVGSLISIFGSPTAWQGAHEVQWWGSYPGMPETGFKGTDFWGVFAVFFPATTGILAGADMSGDLKDPRRSIPRGTLWALGLSSVVYFALAWWCTRMGKPGELAGNYNLVIDRSLFPPLVLAGLLGATASSALAGLVGGPRILMAMGQQRLLPFSETMARTGPDGNPRAAILITAALTLCCIMVRDLNALAPVVTMFFLITYCMLNVVVLLESSLGLVSFRPTLRIPRIIPLFGLLGCIFAMFIVNPTFGLISIGLVITFYLWIHRQHRNVSVDEKEQGVRSSVMVAMAQWAATQVTEQEHNNQRAWKPNLLVPVSDPEVVRGEFQVLMDMTRPDGSVTLVGLLQPDAFPQERQELVGRLNDLSAEFRAAGVQSSAAVVQTEHRLQGVEVTLQALQAAFFRPNVLVIPLDESAEDDAHVRKCSGVAHSLQVGMLTIAIHPRAGFGQRRRVNMWVQPSPGSWEAVAAFSSGNLNLNLLTGYRLLRAWDAEVRLMTCTRHAEDEARAHDFLRALCDLARFPSSVQRLVVHGDFEAQLAAAPIADVTIIGIPQTPSPEVMRRWVELSRSTCIFVRDSGKENALL